MAHSHYDGSLGRRTDPRRSREIISANMDKTTEPASGAEVQRGKLRNRWLIALPFLLGAAGGLAGLKVLPATSADIGPATVSASAAVGRGQTILRIPLLGSIAAATHSAPLEITLAIDEVDPAAIEQAFSNARNRQRLSGELQTGLAAAAGSLAWRAIAGAGLIGALAAVALPRRRLWWAAAGAAGGLIAGGGLFGLTATQFEVQAFQEPRFNGPVERAPEIIQAVQRRAGSIQDLRSRFSSGANRLSQILALAGNPIDNPHTGAVAILHISDIHSNPLGLELARQLAVNFKVDAILDTGDITSFGEPVEGRIAQLIPSMPAPYLLVPGNHDSDQNRLTLSQTPNLTLLHDVVMDVKGVKIMGWADPAFTAKDGDSQQEADRLQRTEAGAVAERVAELRPDVLAVHSPLLGGKSAGEVPLLLAGHRHRQNRREEKGTVMLEVGSTGATGLGSFLVEADEDYQAQIIYLRDSRPVAFDYIRLRAFGAEFEVERQTLTPDSAD